MVDKTSKISVTIVTPHGNLEEYEVNHIRAPGSEGDFGVLPAHLPFITSLRTGTIRLDSDQGNSIWAVSGGYVEVLNDQVTILAETAERSDIIDTDRADAARNRALGRLSEMSHDLDVERARLALVKSLNRIKVASEAING